MSQARDAMQIRRSRGSSLPLPATVCFTVKKNVKHPTRPNRAGAPDYELTSGEITRWRAGSWPSL